MRMKANQWRVISLFIILFSTICFSSPVAALTKKTKPDKIGAFYFIENNIDDNYFIKTNSTNTSYVYFEGPNNMNTEIAWNRQYLANMSSSDLSASSSMMDSWLENSPVSNPFTGLPCQYSYATCSSSGGALSTVTDAQGYYGAITTHDTAIIIYYQPFYIGATLSDAFFQYLRQLATGGSFSSTLNECSVSSSDGYDAKNGERCKDSNAMSGRWYASKVTLTKNGHLKLMNTNQVDEVFINSDGVPTHAEGNTNCRLQVLDNVSGMACKLVNYDLQTNGASNTNIHVYPVIKNTSLASAIGANDLQFSLTGNGWQKFNGYIQYEDGETYYYTLDDMRSSNAIYVFFSNNFFKQMVALGISDIDSQDLFHFIMTGGIKYYFNTSNSLEIKPREFSINISSEDFSDAPSREGYVGSSQPSLDFNYIVTTSGKTAADEVLIKVTGPTQELKGRPYCVFSSDDGTARVPFPATLSFTRQDGSINTYDVGCDGSWRDMTDALWISSAWTDISGEAGVMDKATVKFSILMNDIISMRTLDNNSGWYGDVSASGEIHVQATWRDIN
jgi:hypothetical protein